MFGRDQEAPEWLVQGLVEVLVRWKDQWNPRPTVVVAIPSTTKPLLVGSVATKIADIGRLKLVDAITLVGEPTQRDLSTKARAAYQEPRIGIFNQDSVNGESVLLVDDRLRTGWTMTIAGALLREAGAEAVYPLVVHKQPAG